MTWTLKGNDFLVRPFLVRPFLVRPFLVRPFPIRLFLHINKKITLRDFGTGHVRVSLQRKRALNEYDF